jgi:hypothetical protein
MYNKPLMSVNWIEHQENKIIFINAANLGDDHVSLTADLNSLVALLQKEPKNSVLALADLRNTHLSNTALMALMRYAITAIRYFRRSALVIEASYARRIVLDSFSLIIEHPPKQFSDIETAKEWLVSE